MKTRLHIVKIGGQIMDDTNEIAKALDLFAAINAPKILVHDNGAQASYVSEHLGILAQMINGPKIADADSLKVLKMLHVGFLNKSLVGQLQARNINALGLSGADLNAIQVSKLDTYDIDYGFIGKIEKINSSAIQQLIQAKIVPVFCTITHDKKGELLHSDADSIASRMAIAMSEFYEVQLQFCSDQQGVLMNEDDSDSFIPSISKPQYDLFVEEEIISPELSPQLDNAFLAIQNKVKHVSIGSIDALNPAAKVKGTTISL